jgi:hypothetical protein
LLIEFQRAICQNLNNHYFRIRPRLRIRTPRYLHLHAPRIRDDHEDHQQNQQNIDKRDHVHFCERSALCSANLYAHEPPRVKHLSREENSHIRTKIRCLLAGFELGGNQSDLVDAGGTHDIDGMRDVGEQYIVIAFDESNFLRTILEDLLDPRT